MLEDYTFVILNESHSKHVCKRINETFFTNLLLFQTYADANTKKIIKKLIMFAKYFVFILLHNIL